MYFEYIQSKSEVAPSQVSIFKKSAETEVKNFPADQVRKAAAFISYLSRLNFKLQTFIIAFATLCALSPKIKTLMPVRASKGFH